MIGTTQSPALKVDSAPVGRDQFTGAVEQIGHGAARHRNAESPELLLHSVQRQGVTALADDQVREKSWSILCLVEHLIGHGRRNDVLAAAARERLASKDALAEVALNVFGYLARFTFVLRNGGARVPATHLAAR